MPYFCAACVCVCVCVCACMYTNTHTHTHTNVHAQNTHTCSAKRARPWLNADGRRPSVHGRAGHLVREPSARDPSARVHHHALRARSRATRCRSHCARARRRARGLARGRARPPPSTRLVKSCASWKAALLLPRHRAGRLRRLPNQCQKRPTIGAKEI